MWTKTAASLSAEADKGRDAPSARARRAMEGLADHVTCGSRRELRLLEEQVALLGPSCSRELIAAQDEAIAAADALIAHLAAATPR